MYNLAVSFAVTPMNKQTPPLGPYRQLKITARRSNSQLLIGRHAGFGNLNPTHADRLLSPWIRTHSLVTAIDLILASFKESAFDVGRKEF